MPASMEYTVNSPKHPAFTVFYLLGIVLAMPVLAVYFTGCAFYSVFLSAAYRATGVSTDLSLTARG
jgi:hypothetical protein